jgi:hypothetical protein
MRYPVTLLMGLEYVGLALIPAVLNQDYFLPFIASIVVAGLLVTFLVETVFLIGRHEDSPVRPVRYIKPGVCWTVMLIGSLAHLAATYLGAGTYTTQVGLTVASPLVTLLTPLLPWAIFGCGFALASWRVGMMSRRNLILLLVVAVLFTLAAVVHGGIYAPVMTFGLTLAAGLTLAGFLRSRWLVVGLVIAVLVWPILYSARSNTRQLADTAGLGVASVGAQSRFREDLLLQQAALYGQLNVPQPAVVDILRYGLIPRFLDTGRAEVTSAYDLNVAIGGVNTSAQTFTVWGNLYSLNGGYVGVIMYTLLVAIAFSLVARRLTPMRMGLAMLMVSTLLWVESQYPVNVTGLLQGVVSLVVAMLLARVLNRPGTPGLETPSR